MRFFPNLFWLFVAAASVLVIVRIADDYLTNIGSLQNFRWRIAQFDRPSDNAAQTNIVLEAQNRSNLDLTVKELEIYLWGNDITIGKTYDRFEPRFIKAGEVARVPLVIEVTASFLRDAKANAHGADQWRVTGSYKISTSRVENDFVYRLNIPWLNAQGASPNCCQLPLRGD